MTTQRAEQIIVISLVVTLASTVGSGLAENRAKGNEHEKEKYYGKRIVGGFLSMLFLSLMAQAAPEPAAYLSVGVGSYSFFHYGLPAINKDYSKKSRSSAKEAGQGFTEPALTTLGVSLV